MHRKWRGTHFCSFTVFYKCYKPVFVRGRFHTHCWGGLQIGIAFLDGNLAICIKSLKNMSHSGHSTSSSLFYRSNPDGHRDVYTTYSQCFWQGKTNCLNLMAKNWLHYGTSVWWNTTWYIIKWKKQDYEIPSILQFYFCYP